MKIEVRCTSVRIVPSDASGFLLDAEVADRTEILRQAILEMTEAEIDNAFGKENTDRAAEHTRRLIDWTVERTSLRARIAALEETLRGVVALRPILAKWRRRGAGMTVRGDDDPEDGSMVRKLETLILAAELLNVVPAPAEDDAPLFHGSIDEHGDVTLEDED